MPTILCYGDSNTWGAVPNKSRRYTAKERWPALLNDLLAHSFSGSIEIIEAGQPGRTTVHDDPFEGEKNGLKYLRPCLESHLPDVVVVMLGTNDLKSRFSLTPYDVGLGITRLVSEIFSFTHMAKPRSPKVLLVSPPPIFEVGYFADMFAGGAEKSQQLAQVYQHCAKQLNCAFFDAGTVVESCRKEGIHWKVDQHKKLAKALAVEIKTLANSGQAY
jgi:lysophospholipase L1-like esterase